MGRSLRADDRDGIVGSRSPMRQVAQLLLMCDRHTSGSRSTRKRERESERRHNGEIFVYDKLSRRIGFSAAVSMHRELVERRTI